LLLLFARGERKKCREATSSLDLEEKKTFNAQD
jgi:hypothetical protein